MPSLSDNEVKIKISTQADTSGIKNAEDSYKNLTSSVAAGNAIWDVTKNSLIGIKNAVTGFIENAAEVEMLRASLDTLTGSADKGKKMFSDLYSMASKTPFETTDLVSATKTLLSYGVAQEDIINQLKVLGDISLGDKNKLSSLSLAFGQVQAKGRLMGGELLQMVNTGFNPLQIISKKTGESMLSLTKKMEDGKISVDMVKDAMTSATSEGGLFYQGMDRGARTLSGTWSTLQDNIGTVTRKLVGMSETGEIVKGGLFDKIATGVSNLNTWLSSNQSLVDEWSKKFADGMAAVWDIGSKVFKMIYDFAGWSYANKDWLLPIIEGLALVKAAFMIQGVVDSAIASVAAFKLAVLSPIVMPAIVVGAALLAIQQVWNAYNDMQSAINREQAALQTTLNIKKAGVAENLRVYNDGISSPERKQRAKDYLHNEGVPGFSIGGFTGRGSGNEVAGLVHKGEYVVPKNQVDQSTGLPKANSGGIVINNTNYFNRESDSAAYVRELGYMLSRA